MPKIPTPTPRPPYERDTKMDPIEQNNYDLLSKKRFNNPSGKSGDDRLSDDERLYHATNPAGRLGGVADSDATPIQPTNPSYYSR